VTYLSDKYLGREIDYSRSPVNPTALIVIRHATGFTLAYDVGKSALCGIRENAPETARQAWVDQAKAQGLAVLTMNAPAQAALPCTGPDVRGLLRQKAAAPIKPRKPQVACDIGLFSDEADQLDLVSFFTEQSEQ
jgi:hypothetical protein